MLLSARLLEFMIHLRIPLALLYNTECMVQCVWLKLDYECVCFFFYVSSHHFNPILREYETMVWFFIFQKKNFPGAYTHTHTAFLRSYFTNWFYCALNIEFGHIFLSFFRLDCILCREQNSNLCMRCCRCMKCSWTKIPRTCNWIFVYLRDSKLRFARRVNCKAKFLYIEYSKVGMERWWQKKISAYRFILEWTEKQNSDDIYFVATISRKCYAWNILLNHGTLFIIKCGF